MQNWFECKVKYTKIDERSGKEKRVAESYLVDAISFTEAEERIYKEMEAYISGEFTVTNIRKANYTDVIQNIENMGDRWYKSRITFVSIDENAGKEKKVANTMLVLANDVKEARDNIDIALSGMTVDYDVTGITESPIIDFFPYFNDGAEPGEKGKQLATQRAARIAANQKPTDDGDADV